MVNCSSSRNADDIERIVRENVAQGVHNFFITDDNFARNRNWESMFDRLIKMREEDGLRFHIVAQVDTMAHKIRGFIDKAGRAGVNRHHSTGTAHRLARVLHSHPAPRLG